MDYVYLVFLVHIRPFQAPTNSIQIPRSLSECPTKYVIHYFLLYCLLLFRLYDSRTSHTVAQFRSIVLNGLLINCRNNFSSVATARIGKKNLSQLGKEQSKKQIMLRITESSHEKLDAVKNICTNSKDLSSTKIHNVILS